MAGNRACPACRAVGRDKDGDHLFLMRDGSTWACSRNGVYHEPYFEGLQNQLSFINAAQPVNQWPAPSSSFAVQQQSMNRKPTLDEVAQLPSLAIRGIPMDVVTFYDVKCETNPLSNEIIKHYYPITKNKKIVSYHVRELPKNFYGLKKSSELPDGLDLFGTSTITSKPTHIVITEGQIDAMSAFYMLARLHKVDRLRVVSLNNGANMASLIANASWIQRVQHKYFCPDQDDVGTKLIPEVSKLINGIKIMRFSEKDPSDMLDKGKTREFYEAWQRAERYTPMGVVKANVLKSKAMEEIQPGLSYPFPTLTKLTYGLRTPAIIAVGAGPGCGKTTFCHKLIEHIVYTHNKKVGAFFLEDRPHESLRRLAGHIMRLPIHLPGIPYDRAALSTVLDSLDDRIYLFDRAGYRGWEDIENAMRYMVAEGVQFFFIDPLSALHSHLDATATNQFLNTAMYQMSLMKDELDITIFHINHLNNPDGSKDHNEGAPVKASQFTGSRAQWRFSTDVWGLSRDSTNADLIIRNTTTLTILKNRLAGEFGRVDIRYDPATGTLEEPPLPTMF